MKKPIKIKTSNKNNFKNIKKKSSSVKSVKQKIIIDPNASTLEVKNLTKYFGKKAAVKNASFSMRQGEIVGLLGPNGAGKTTIFYMIVGFIKPTDGNIYMDHHIITNLPMYKRAKLGISYLSQEASIFRKLTVEENIEAVLEILDISDEEKKRRKEEVIHDLGIGYLAKQKAYSLSGGERRRTEIARALVINPKFLLMDEPFAGIDPIAVSDIQEIVSKLKTKGIGVLITDHNVRETLEITDRAYIINLGDIFRSGTSKQLVNDPMVRKLYLGENFSF
jgi:lipopolysaccharide export system ATP-binding protein